MVHKANQVADKLAREGISVEVVDPRTISPLDEEGILESVASTGRVVIVDESAARFGFAHDVAALIASQAFHFLKAPVLLVTPPHTPVPFSLLSKNSGSLALNVSKPPSVKCWRINL